MASPRATTTPNQINASPLIATQVHPLPPSASPPDYMKPSMNDPNARYYQFGSDSNFRKDGFLPRSDRDRHEVVEERLVEELKQMRPINRDDRHRESDPKFPPTVNPMKRKLSTSRTTRETGTASDDEEHAAETASLATPTAPSPATKRRKSQLRRRSSLSGPAAKKEVLTDEQKRANHISSESKRRAKIKGRFDEVNELVPELVRQGAGLSKSNMLVETTRFVESLLNNNPEMKRRLDEARGYHG
jgi:hypothetical protein